MPEDLARAPAEDLGAGIVVETAQRDPTGVAEVDLCLLARPRLEPGGGDCGPLPRRALGLRVALDLQVAAGKAQTSQLAMQHSTAWHRSS
jgi:hypothetical protein